MQSVRPNGPRSDAPGVLASLRAVLGAGNNTEETARGRGSVILIKESSRDWGLVVLVALLSIGANLPEQWTAYLSIDRRYLLAGLVGVVAIALLRYVKLTLILIVVFLAIGANLPKDLADEFGVDPQIMLLGLVAMIVIAISNRFLKLPTGLEKTGRPQSGHGAAALFSAVLKGRIAAVQTLLAQGVNVNVRTVSGKTPLMAAAYKGYGDIVQLLIEGGANLYVRDARGDTALSIAERLGYTRIVELLRQAAARAEGAATSTGPTSLQPAVTGPNRLNPK